MPRELVIYFAASEHSERFSLNEFFKRVSEREQLTLPKPIHHARVVIEPRLARKILKGLMRIARRFSAGYEGGMWRVPKGRLEFQLIARGF